jgi:ParB family transcriptional regulator, chromosome partitioning protein
VATPLPRDHPTKMPRLPRTGLHAPIGEGRTVLLAPEMVDVGGTSTRLALGGSELALLKKSIERDGQQTPILVRPLEGESNRYGLVFGRRRIMACRELGIPIRAEIRTLSDEEALIAQGQENAARRDLTFIERAMFARQLDLRGYTRQTIMAALCVHTAEVTRLMQVARAVPEEVIRAIGPAPKAGRPRWMKLAERLTNAQAGITEGILLDPNFEHADSNKRFRMLFNGIAPRLPPVTPRRFSTYDGKQAIVVLKHRFEVNERGVPGFSAFLEARIPALLAEFSGRADADPASTVTSQKR